MVYILLGHDLVLRPVSSTQDLGPNSLHSTIFSGEGYSPYA